MLFVMEVVANERANQTSRSYIAYQPVIKESSTTTKLKVVFDASSKLTTGKLLKIILRRPDDHQFQTVDSVDPIQEYQLP